MTATPRSTATARRKRRKARTGHRSLAERLRAAVHSAGACRVAETVAGRVPEESCESCEERPARDAPDTVCGGTPQPLGSTARTWIVSQPSVRWSASSAQAAPRLSSIHNPQSSIPNPQSSILNPQSTIHNPQSSILNPQSSILNPQSSILNLFSSPMTPPPPPLRKGLFFFSCVLRLVPRLFARSHP
jgi:hypothetical protein